MAVALINLGNYANDGGGDDLRTAFEKVNSNFSFLEIEKVSIFGNTVAPGATVFKDADENTINFRSIIPGNNNITIVQNENSISISASDAPGTFITADDGSLVLTPGQSYNIIGADGITVSADPETRRITVVGGLVNDPAPTLTTTLDANQNDIINVLSINGVPWDQTVSRLFDLDFGPIAVNIKNIIDLIINQFDVDMGSITSPNTTLVELGDTGSFVV
jgi:hypothetical protein